jgi:hypothetical protein
MPVYGVINKNIFTFRYIALWQQIKIQAQKDLMQHFAGK